MSSVLHHFIFTLLAVIKFPCCFLFLWHKHHYLTQFKSQNTSLKSIRKLLVRQACVTKPSFISNYKDGTYHIILIQNIHILASHLNQLEIRTPNLQLLKVTRNIQGLKHWNILAGYWKILEKNWLSSNTSLIKHSVWYSATRLPLDQT